MKRILAALLLSLWAIGASAQVTVPNTLVNGDTITVGPLNTNFATIANHALDRLAGGNIAGNVTVDALVTIDGVDVGVQACVACNPTHAKLTLTNATSTALTITGGITAGGALALGGAINATGAITTGGGITAGSGVVGIVNSTGKIPAISSTYFASLDGTNLTGLGLLAGTNNWTAGNAFFGATGLQQYVETFSQPAITAGSLTLDLTTASHFYVSLNANCALVITGALGGNRVSSFTLSLVADGTPRVFNWPANTHWANSVAPTLSTANGATDVIQCFTLAANSHYYCFVAGQAL